MLCQTRGWAFRMRCPPSLFAARPLPGLAAFKRHLSYLPHSGSVLPELAKQLTGYSQTKSALHFPIGEPLPDALIRQLLNVRMR